MESAPDPAWDALVEATPGGDLVQTTAWAATRQRIGYRAAHLRLSSAGGRLIGGCIIQFKSTLAGLRIGAVARGPLLFLDEPDAAAQIVHHMVCAARRLRIGVLIVQPPEGSTILLEAMTAAGFRIGGPNVVPEATIRLDLRRPEDEILRNMNSNRRRRIRETLRGGLITSRTDDVETFHRLHVASATRQGFRPVSIEELRAQWEILAPLGVCRLFVTRDGDVPVAGEWMTSFGGMLVSRFRGYDAARIAAKAAPSAAMWACILWAKREGLRCLDFHGFDRNTIEHLAAGRAPPPEFSQSIAYFKRSFGGTGVLFPKTQFIFTSSLMHTAFAGVTHRLLANASVRSLARGMNGLVRFHGTTEATTDMWPHTIIRAVVELIRGTWLGLSNRLVRRAQRRSARVPTTVSRTAARQQVEMPKPTPGAWLAGIWQELLR